MSDDDVRVCSTDYYSGCRCSWEAQKEVQFCRGQNGWWCKSQEFSPFDPESWYLSCVVVSVCCVIDRSYPPWRAAIGTICWPRTTASLIMFRLTDRTMGLLIVIGLCLTHSLSFVLKNKCLVLQKKSFCWFSLNLKPIYLIHKQVVTQPKFQNFTGISFPPCHSEE